MSLASSRNKQIYTNNKDDDVLFLTIESNHLPKVNKDSKNKLFKEHTDFHEKLQKVYSEDKIKHIIDDKNNIIKLCKAIKNKNRYLRSK